MNSVPYSSNSMLFMAALLHRAGHYIFALWFLSSSLWTTACRSPIFDFPSRKAITRVQTSPHVDISRHSNGHISVVRHATVRWLGVLVVLHVAYCACWYDLDPIQGHVKVTGLLNFWKLAKPCMHAGGDDRQPPSGAFWFVSLLSVSLSRGSMLK